jgi:hypothetical protein
MSERVLSQYYQHIDNGGLSIKVCQTDDQDSKSVFLEIGTSYFGYPDVMARVSGWGHLNSDTLKRIADAFREAAFKLEANENAN